MDITRYEVRGPRDAGGMNMHASENPLDDEGAVEVLISFTGGETWAAVNILAREHGVVPASALATCVAYGLLALGYDVPLPVLVAVEVAA